MKEHQKFPHLPQLAETAKQRQSRRAKIATSAGLAAVVATGAFFVTKGSGESKETHPSVTASQEANRHHIDRAAKEIVNRYECTNVKVEDLKRPPTKDEYKLADGIPRTVLKIDLNLKVKDSAKPSLDEYAHDDTVSWSDPVVRAAVKGVGMAGPGEGTKLTKLDEDSSHAEKRFSPATVYPPGTTAVVSVTTEVRASFADEEVSSARYSTALPCGVLKFDGKEWLFDKAAALPPIEEPEVELLYPPSQQTN